MKTYIDKALEGLRAAAYALSEPRTSRTVSEAQQHIADAIAFLDPLSNARSQVLSSTGEKVPGIAPLELELLRAVLPSGYTIVNEGTEDVALYDGDDWQQPLSQFSTARGELDVLIREVERSARIHGKAEVQHYVKKALGIDHDLERVREAAETSIDKLEARVIKMVKG
ncbi:MAG TPA: hypothetical protein PLB89_05145 [Flavobacteriales bacterium]|nr:hypothetical protein [Flavobacteriales bacterium]